MISTVVSTRTLRRSSVHVWNGLLVRFSEASKSISPSRMRGGLLNQRLMFGVLLENLAVPTVEICAAGSVAEVHVASRLFERGGGDPGEQPLHAQRSRRESRFVTQLPVTTFDAPFGRY